MYLIDGPRRKLLNTTKIKHIILYLPVNLTKAKIELWLNCSRAPLRLKEFLEC